MRIRRYWQKKLRCLQGSVKWNRAADRMYSILETCKQHQIIRSSISSVLARIPNTKQQDIRSLCPTIGVPALADRAWAGKGVVCRVFTGYRYLLPLVFSAVIISASASGWLAAATLAEAYLPTAVANLKANSIAKCLIALVCSFCSLELSFRRYSTVWGCISLSSCRHISLSLELRLFSQFFW